MNSLAYNERAWAIDVVTAIGSYTQTKKLAIRRAGGEHTLGSPGAKKLFPDVLLFGDEDGVRVRHGWELKFPDTPITDQALISNAVEKAERLRVNSFLLWNVDRAALYVKSDTGDEFLPVQEWGPIAVKTRSQVQESRQAWQDLLRQILDFLNDYFSKGILTSSAPREFLDDGLFADFLEQYTGIATDSMRKAANANATIDAASMSWWRLNARSYGHDPDNDFPKRHAVLARSSIVNWINRFIFTHYLKLFREEAKAIDAIVDEMSIEEAEDRFQQISSACNFMQIFAVEGAARYIGDETWAGLKQLNAFLVDLVLDGVSQATLRETLERTISATRRRAFGQFTTPDNLASLLVNLAIEDREGAVLDPCCGTGTIPKAAYRLKRQKGVSVDEALRTVWASDKFQFPLQLATIALAEPVAMRKVIQVFRSDVFDLDTSRPVELIDPDTGSYVERKLGAVQTIVSNLPFVQFEDIAEFNPGIREAVLNLTGGVPLDSRTDLFGYIVIFLRTLIRENGRIGLIVSNSWLSSSWGIALRDRLNDLNIETVVTSGKGRWFDNAQVVTNIVVFSRKGKEVPPTRFIVTRRKLADWDQAYIDSILAADREKADVDSEEFALRSYDQKTLSLIEQTCVGWSAPFADVDWIADVKPRLVKASEHLNIGRGYRRGWNAMFYPKENGDDEEHGIEERFLEPVLKDVRGINSLEIDFTSLDSSFLTDAFCCGVSEADLLREENAGALAWVRRFEREVNGKGVPLPQVLRQGRRPWYEMRLDKGADMVISMNPDRRLYVAKLDSRRFVDQRLVSFSKRQPEADIELIHALLNTSLGLFLIEASGFGRGLGALDLTPTKLKENLRMNRPGIAGGILV